MFRLKLPYTIIDTGFWHQLSFPKLSSGKTDKVHLYGGENIVYHDGNAKTLLTDLRDIGRWVATIIKDPRTLNKRVVTWSDELSQNEIFKLVEGMSGERVQYSIMKAEDLITRFEAAKRAYQKSIEGHTGPIMMYNPERMTLSTLEYTLGILTLESSSPILSL
jgi:hypothetical protein